MSIGVLIGNIIKTTATFRDENDAVQDPAHIEVKVKDPNGSVTTYVYLVGTVIHHVSKGVYYIETDTTGKLGTFQFIWNSTGTYQAAGQTEFTVVNTLF